MTFSETLSYFLFLGYWVTMATGLPWQHISLVILLQTFISHIHIQKQFYLESFVWANLAQTSSLYL